MGVQDVRVHVFSLTICGHLSFIFITGVTLSTILSFFTGFECIPPLGLPLQPSLTFELNMPITKNLSATWMKVYLVMGALGSAIIALSLSNRYL